MRTIVPINNRSVALDDASTAPDEVASEAEIADDLVRFFAGRADVKFPGKGAGAAVLRIDEVVARVAEPRLRLFVAVRLLRMHLDFIAEHLDDNDSHSTPESYAYVALGDTERELGNEEAADRWFARVREISEAEQAIRRSEAARRGWQTRRRSAEPASRSTR